jgi:hypothetical protein
LSLSFLYWPERFACAARVCCAWRRATKLRLSWSPNDAIVMWYPEHARCLIGAVKAGLQPPAVSMNLYPEPSDAVARPLVDALQKLSGLESLNLWFGTWQHRWMRWQPELYPRLRSLIVRDSTSALWGPLHFRVLSTLSALQELTFSRTYDYDKPLRGVPEALASLAALPLTAFDVRAETTDAVLLAFAAHRTPRA